MGKKSRLKQQRRQMEFALADIYATIPKINCIGLCHQSCSGAVPTFSIEKTVLGHNAPELGDPSGDCKHLHDRRCSIYERRPIVCRLFGVVENMPCPFGCVPESGYLSPQAEADILAKLRRIE